MNPAELKARFPTEAALCTCLIDCLAAAGGWEIYPETAGFDILAVWKATGHQLGIEAKLQLNAKVADQILPAHWSNAHQRGPDFRAVLVPCTTAANYGIARMLDALGVQVLVPDSCIGRWKMEPGQQIQREVQRHGLHQAAPWDRASGDLREWGPTAWFDWNPTKRCELPEFVPKVAAGVPSPLQLTPWKVGALKVLADLELDGFTTAKGVRAHGVDPRRFCATDGWLKPLGGGKWARGTLPAFEDQHPEAYAQVLANARAARAAADPKKTLEQTP
ncbi:hypothetical protein [Stenotrophomonas maltophilia]|uniref:hypothetical protein n=1 Tax=Stenotrophomonas maltophilia TaxID=40324 RepID=UPI00027A729E|nr:hypothetical protein [Stenotrophomonas maltophilia]AVH90210.1 hypothetical protein AL480_04945 [Stenotrophomonas maltophilia]EJP77088.1 hypothetical protein A1OC_01897 [Stenotrophomonas maltophilia Ab55555]ELE7120948.1 hypothetical protein [Stenotrophomonas maltophilia]MBA0233618.1 hypothetical protein [Stenotrophomonas maltophilia]MBA0267151.1 hypothetical protein [Stenotrophomonas maltophilia]